MCYLNPMQDTCIKSLSISNLINEILFLLNFADEETAKQKNLNNLHKIK